MSFNGFISYSHAADGRLAPAVQRGLHRLAKPWHRRRALWIFRDQTGLSVTPGLWTSIQRALDTSDYFVLMASPEAARSQWVNREIEHWVATKPLDRILPVVTDGEWQWDAEAGDFAESCTSVPPALRGVFAEEPLYLDLRWARNSQHLSLRHSRFRDAIAQLAAPMHGVSKDDLEGEDVRQHRWAARLRVAAVTALLALSGVALLAGMFAAQNAAEASAASLEAQLQEQEAVAQRGSAARYADEAQRQETLAREQEKRAQDAAAEARRQERLAQEQKGLAGDASAEAARQLANADRAAARARTQEKLAQRQSELARESARQMRRQEQRAKEQERIARDQQRLAAEAGAEARRQEEIAREQEKRADEARAEALKQQGKADEQQRLAVSRQLITEAKDLIVSDPQRSAMLGVAAQAVHSGPETRRELAGLVSSTRYAGEMVGVSGIEYGPGHLVATPHAAGTVSLWNVENRSHPVRLSTFGLLAESSTLVRFSPDGESLVLAQDGVVTLWDIRNPAKPTEVATLPRDRPYWQIELSPDGNTLATGDNVAGSDRHATLWDISDRTQPVELSGLTGGDAFGAADLQFAPDGRTLVSVTNGIRVWDVSDLRQPAHRSTIERPSFLIGFAMNPARPQLAVGDDTGWITFYDLTNPAQPRTAGQVRSDLGRLAYSPDGTLLATGDSNGQIRLFEFGADGPQQTGEFTSRSQIHSLALSGDRRTLITTDDENRGILWNTTEFAAPQRTAEVFAREATVVGSSTRAGDRLLTTVGSDGKAVFWDTGNRARPVPVDTVTVHAGMATSAVFSADGQTVVVGGAWDGMVTVSDLSDPGAAVTLAEFDPGLDSLVVQGISRDGRTLAIGGRGRQQYWDLSKPSKPTLLRDQPTYDEVAGLVVDSPDGRVQAQASNDNVIFLYDVSNRDEPRHLGVMDGHRDIVSLITFSPDGKLAATASRDHKAYLWDLSDPTQPYRIANLSSSPTETTSFAFSADGRTLAVGSGESWVATWDIAIPARPIRLTVLPLGHLQRPDGMLFSADGNTLAIPSEIPMSRSRPTDRSYLGVWDVSPLNELRADPAKFGCQIAGRGLTEAEWRRQIPELPYVRSC